MRGKKTYNIRNIEAHISGLENAYKQNTTFVPNHMGFSKNLIFQTNALNVIKTKANILTRKLVRQNIHQILFLVKCSKIGNNVISLFASPFLDSEFNTILGNNPNDGIRNP